MSKQIFLDIETTGFSREWDNIIELAAICIDTETQEIIDEFHEYIKPNKKIPANITELTGITNEQVSNCRNELLVLMDFVEWFYQLNPDSVVGHNCKSFDLSFIQEKCAKYNLHYDMSSIDIIDTLILARQLNKQGKISVANCKQVTIAEYFNINYVAHSAIEDIKALIQIYQKMKKLNQPVTRSQLGF